MSATAAQIVRQIETNEDELMAVFDRIQKSSPVDPRRAAWEKRRKQLSQAQTYWATEYRKVTGVYLGTGSEWPFDPSVQSRVIADERVAEKKAREAEKQKEQARRAAKKPGIEKLLGYAEMDHHRLSRQVQEALDLLGEGQDGVIQGKLAKAALGADTAALVKLLDQLVRIRKTLDTARTALTRGDVDYTERLVGDVGNELTQVASKFKDWQGGLRKW